MITRPAFMYFFPFRRAGGTSASLRIACSSSSRRKNATEKPASTALTPNEIAKCVFPTPGGPRIRSPCFSRSQAQVASASSFDRCTAGWNAKSKFASVWPVGRAEDPQRRPPPPLLAPFQLILEQLLEQGRRAQVLHDGAAQD